MPTYHSVTNGQGNDRILLPFNVSRIETLQLTDLLQPSTIPTDTLNHKPRREKIRCRNQLQPQNLLEHDRRVDKEDDVSGRGPCVVLSDSCSTCMSRDALLKMLLMIIRRRWLWRCWWVEHIVSVHSSCKTTSNWNEREKTTLKQVSEAGRPHSPSSMVPV